MPTAPPLFFARDSLEGRKLFFFFFLFNMVTEMNSFREKQVNAL